MYLSIPLPPKLLWSKLVVTCRSLKDAEVFSTKRSREGHYTHKKTDKADLCLSLMWSGNGKSTQ